MWGKSNSDTHRLGGISVINCNDLLECMYDVNLACFINTFKMNTLIELYNHSTIKVICVRVFLLIE